MTSPGRAGHVTLGLLELPHSSPHSIEQPRFFWSVAIWSDDFDVFFGRPLLA